MVFVRQLGRRPPGSAGRAHAERPSLPARIRGRGHSVTAAVSLYGYYGELAAAARPPRRLAYVRADAPPFFVAHGDHDTLVLVEDAGVRRACGGSSNPVVYVELPGAQHAFDLFHSIRFEAVVDAIEAFAAWVRSRQVQLP